MIISADSLKILGFTFGRRPTVWAHFNEIKKKYVARTHNIRHLRKIGFSAERLCRIFSAMIRPVIEFAAQIYHHMLSDEINGEIERLQRDVLKCIFGFKTPYRVALEKSGLESLEERRKSLALKFALDAEKNPRYSSWFPAHEEYRHNIRDKAKYKEDFALYDRTRNSPVFAMRRMLNSYYSRQQATAND